MSVDVIVIGCDHMFQSDDGLGDTLLNSGRAEFRALIESLVKERPIQFIGEESPDRYKSFGRLIARKKHAQKGYETRWANIDIPRKIRDKLGVPEDSVRQTRMAPRNADLFPIKATGRRA